ncbi:MAG: cyclic pyranopterin monophosphate synthase MoaC [Gemmatimonadota bacterium]|nr:MAG: cyclic pyranopterin monophosphate synthase MoaC [Gemmatimonadota bacterium]
MTGKKSKMTHVDAGGTVRMVDVAGKDTSRRTATAEGRIRMQRSTLDAIRQNTVEKGDVLAVAKISGVTAGKRAAEWIPLCHPLQIDVIDVSLTLDEDLPGVKVQARAGVTGRTGAEMEALVAASAALLTVYDMCKALDRGMEIDSVRLVEKSGGRSGTWRRRDS